MVGSRCTTRQHDTHLIESRELRYPWHPWHGRLVWIQGKSERAGVPVFHCVLEPDWSVRLLEIPQWMFDASVVCLLHFASAPQASCEALGALKELLSHHTPRRLTVIQAQQQSPDTGGSDAKRSQDAASRPAAVVSSSDHPSSLGEHADGGPPQYRNAACTVVARSRAPQRAVRNGGGR